MVQTWKIKSSCPLCGLETLFANATTFDQDELFVVLDAVTGDRHCLTCVALAVEGRVTCLI